MRGPSGNKRAFPNPLGAAQCKRSHRDLAAHAQACMRYLPCDTIGIHILSIHVSLRQTRIEQCHRVCQLCDSTSRWRRSGCGCRIEDWRRQFRQLAHARRCALGAALARALSAACRAAAVHGSQGYSRCGARPAPRRGLFILCLRPHVRMQRTQPRAGVCRHDIIRARGLTLASQRPATQVVS